MSEANLTPSDDPQHALEMFFTMINKEYKDIASEFFRMYKFPDIVLGIFRRYKCLPIGWKSKIEEYSARGELNWLRPSQVRYVTTQTVTFPSVEKMLDFPSEMSQSHYKIKELLEHEYKYIETLRVVVKQYAVQVISMANGRVGVGSQTSLGLSVPQVNYIFGNELTRLYEASNKLWIMLQTLLIVTIEPNKNPDSTGREGELVNIFMAAGGSVMKQYLPYCSRLNFIRKILIHQKRTLGHNSSSEFYFKNLNFEELWEEITKSHPDIENGSLDRLLMKPVKKFPEYILLLKDMRKKMSNDHPALEKVDCCIEFLTKLAQKLDHHISAMKPREEKVFNTLIDFDEI